MPDRCKLRRRERGGREFYKTRFFLVWGFPFCLDTDPPLGELTPIHGTKASTNRKKRPERRLSLSNINGLVGERKAKLRFHVD